ncbi:MAG: lytic murein transglycosylase B [Betaproteobacteria bacterium]|nr:MAG: lytic murein transglycosylase B [Betaproteobacteria bacterium]
MMPALLRTILLACAAAGAHAAGPADFAARPEVRAFIREMVEQHRFVQHELEFVFSRARREPAILEAIQPPTPQARRPWDAYRAIFVNDRRIQAGAEFWRLHGSALERAQREYGVAAEIVVSILGIETFYGRNTGRWRVVDALATLAFDYPPRAGFFRSELANYLRLARDSGIDVFAVRGSYAGAIGIPQFMPGSYLRFAVDFDGDGAADLRASAADAIGSVANFLKQHGWQADAPVVAAASVSGEGYKAFADGSVEPKHPAAELAKAGVRFDGVPPEAHAALIELDNGEAPPEYRLGLANFYVLTRYNRSSFYAAAVADLAAALRAALQPEGR